MATIHVPFSIIGSTDAAYSNYVPVPVRCTLLGAQASPDADPGDAETITFANGSSTLGTLTFDSDIAAGATGTYTANSTYGDLVVAADGVIKITVSQCSAPAVFQGYLEIDPNARPK